MAEPIMVVRTGQSDLLPSERFRMAVEDVQRGMQRIAHALHEAQVPFALIGGQAVALWVGSIDSSATRVTKDVDLLLRREDLPRAITAAQTVDMDYVFSNGVPMFVERSDPSPRAAVHLIFAGEKVRSRDSSPAPLLEEVIEIEPERPVLSVCKLVAMKLMANRDHDRVHLRDMISVGLVAETMADTLPVDLGARLRELFATIRREAEEDR
jgi:hypothetical protein